MRTALLLAFFFIPSFLHAQEPPSSPPVPDGSSKIAVDVGNFKLDVFTYRPKNFKDGPLIVIFHGTNRNADEYRDFGIGMAERFGALIAAPLFDSKQFSSDLYHNGGLLKKGKLQPEDQLTGNLTPKIAAEIRRLEGRPRWPYYFFGHSAGGQFLSRISGFVYPGAVRIVAANPGALSSPRATCRILTVLATFPRKSATTMLSSFIWPSRSRFLSALRMSRRRYCPWVRLP